MDASASRCNNARDTASFGRVDTYRSSPGFLPVPSAVPIGPPVHPLQSRLYNGSTTHRSPETSPTQLDVFSHLQPHIFS
jgi:hypothetical protein